MKKLLLLIVLIALGFLIWKYGVPYFSGTASIIETVDKLKTDVQTSVENLKKEGEEKLKQAEDLKNKVEDKVDKFGKTVDAVNELVK